MGMQLDLFEKHEGVWTDITSNFPSTPGSGDAFNGVWTTEPIL